MAPLRPGLVAERLERVRERIAVAGGDPARVRIVAVTKLVDPDAVEAAVEAGLRDLGENYAQALRARVDAGRWPEVRWHFVGRIQRNKVAALAGTVHLWQAVDRAAVGVELARRAPGAGVLVQVNTTGEATKAGCRPDEAAVLVERLGALGLDVRGLMTIGPAGDAAESRRAFGALARLADGLGLPERSMGMSDDLEAAVAEGATIVRVGRALFGARPGPQIMSGGTGRPTRRALG